MIYELRITNYELKNHKSKIVNLKSKILLLLTAYCLLPAAIFAEQKSLTIAAASDLSFALKEIAKQFEINTGTRVVLSFGSTGMLARQIENGAPFDIFFAANEKYIDELKNGGLIIPDTQKLYAQGRIVLAANKTYGINAKKLEDLLDPSIKKISIANPDHAPYGIAAKEALLKLELWDKLKPKLVYGEIIRQALQYLQTGDVPVGIIALSVANVPEITYTPIDNILHNPINQAAAVIKKTKAEKEAREFIHYVTSPIGRPIMKKYGFLLPGEF
ncbi:MAG: molybdate ABC transporter substrate-binding protein [Deltaproteobacteria bacterium]|nr:molybdate ABC transporter substrate-binding protein [Deltaproteobacteria bacterium]